MNHFERLKTTFNDLGIKFTEADVTDEFEGKTVDKEIAIEAQDITTCFFFKEGNFVNHGAFAPD